MLFLKNSNLIANISNPYNPIIRKFDILILTNKIFKSNLWKNALKEIDFLIFKNRSLEVILLGEIPYVFKG